MRGNILETENQQAIINDIIDVKIGVYLHKTQTNTVKNDKGQGSKIALIILEITEFTSIIVYLDC